MIQLLEKKYADDAFAVITKATRKMELAGISQWDELYPTPAVIQTDIRRGDAYGYFDNGLLRAYAAFNNVFPEEYKAIPWRIPGNHALIVHRLTVDPDFQGKGISKRLMRFAENLAVSKGFCSIRLDAYAENPVALNLYEKMGYTRVGAVEFRKGRFFCFEKSIRPCE